MLGWILGSPILENHRMTYVKGTQFGNPVVYDISLHICAARRKGFFCWTLPYDSLLQVRFALAWAALFRSPAVIRSPHTDPKHRPADSTNHAAGTGMRRENDNDSIQGLPGAGSRPSTNPFGHRPARIQGYGAS